MLNIEKRSIAVCILLSIVTCGIYTFFWMADVINDICTLKGQEKTGARDVILSILTCGVYGLFVLYRIGADIDSLNNYNSYNNILLLLLGFFGFAIIAYAIAQHSLNELS